MKKTVLAIIIVLIVTCGLICTINISRKENDNEQITEKFKLIEKVKVGDYINYIPDSNEYVTSPGNTGCNAQTIKTENTKWKVMMIDNEDQAVFITPEDAVNTGISFQGAKGYLSGPEQLNKMCDTLYSSVELGVNARSMQIEDINSLIDGAPSKEEKRYAYYPKGSNVESTVEYNGNTYVAYVCKEDIVKIYESDAGGMKAKSADGYEYSVPEENNPVYVTETLLDYTNCINQTVNSLLGETQGYLASTCTSVGDTGVYTYIYSTDNTEVKAKRLYHYGSSANLTKSGLRPVVQIDGSIMIDKDGKLVK